MIKGRYLYGNDDDLSDVFAIRKEVFINEYNLSKEEEFDGFDTMCVHALISIHGKKIGTGRICFDGDEYRIGHICILKEEREKKYGDFLVRMLIDKAFLSGAKEVVVAATSDTIPFYEKIGFVKCAINDNDFYGTNYIEMKLNKKTLCKECKK